MAELVVMKWLRPRLAAERQELERLRRRWEEIDEMSRWHPYNPEGDCTEDETYRDYLDMVAEDIREIQDRVRGVVALTACCRDM